MSEQSPAAWHPDPYGRHQQRYWDGNQWTEHVASGGQQGVDPPVDGPPTPTTNASANTVPNTLAPADWYPDPLGRYEHRYWDGSRWTTHVVSHGHQGIDTTGASTAAPGSNAPNKKVERQARRAGATGAGRSVSGQAGSGHSGGGTLFTEDVLVVNQKAKLFGSTLGYAVYAQTGHQLATIQELRRDLGTKMSDSLRGRGETNRTYRFQVLDMNNRVVLAMTRPEKWFTSKSKMIVEGPSGAPIGQLIQETTGLVGGAATLAHVGLTNVSTIAQYNLGFVVGAVAGPAIEGVQRRLNSAVEGLDKVGHVRFGIEAGGQRLGSIHAESLREWNFHIQDPAGTKVATITKTWAGWAKERFTKADNYVVQMHQPLEDPLRSLVVAAALVLDVALKQGDPTSGSRRNRRYS
jgi:hypothetical protein